MKNRIYAVYHSLIVQNHEMTEKAYQLANWANFFLGASLSYTVFLGMDYRSAGLLGITVFLYYMVHNAKKEVES